ncbi:hypothetical protein HF295_03565 [Hujiaoplasma nucleasis]|uniref:Uncharacterized protein n=1 Tax=Hujiaoplasma nucleasis TaxID=2725268 RepID=A0A7L6N4R8_9MOLU|nr:hypothetical protein [Hujiaoplasma nucleasis]QLY39985.1 hypothetical protein HF295_03565 [Hujiaoplasma nucleasis]
MQAIIMYDFIKQETIHFELLTPSSSINNSNYVIGIDEWQNMWLYSQQDHNLVLYTNTGSVITQTNIVRNKVDGRISYMVDQGMFIRYIVDDENIAFIDAYDYINLEEKIISINPNIISEDSQKTIFFNNNMYNVSINDMLSIKDKDNKVYFETTIMTLYESSNLGIQANKILIDLDQENDPNQFGFSLVNNEIYLYYKYNLGFLFNKSLLGSSPYLIFRFDFETNSLKYIGLNDDIYYV